MPKIKPTEPGSVPEVAPESAPAPVVVDHAPVVVEPPPPTLAEQLAAYRWTGNAKVVPSALVVGLSETDLEDLGYVKVVTGVGGTVLRRA